MQEAWRLGAQIMEAEEKWSIEQAVCKQSKRCKGRENFPSFRFLLKTRDQCRPPFKQTYSSSASRRW